MAFTTTVKNTAIDAMTALGADITLHTGDPGVTGANDSGAAAQTTTWGSANNGEATGSPVTFTSAPALHYTHYGVWDSTTFCWGFPLDPGFTLDDVGDVQITPHLTFPG